MDSNLEVQIAKQLKQCCKDEASYTKLEALFDELINKHKKIKKQLYLIEQATRQDYDSIMITDLNLEEPGPKIVYVNEGFTKMTGYAKEEIIGKTPRILQGPKTEPQVVEKLKTRLKNGQSFFGHTVNYKKDGSEFINQWDVHPLSDKNGEVTHWVSYQRDITNRKESNKLLFDTNIDFDNLHTETRQIYVDVNVHGKILTSNLAFKELLGFDAGELKNKRIWDFVSERDQKEVEYLFSDFDQNSIEDKIYTWEFVTKSGEKNVLGGKVNSFSYNHETTVRVHFENVSMKNKVIKALHRKKKQLEDILSIKNEFKLRFARNADGDITCKYVSENFEHITGFTSDMVLKNGMYDMLHKDDVPEVRQALTQAFNGKSAAIHCKYRTSEGDYISGMQIFKPDDGASSENGEYVKSVVTIDLP